MKKCISLIAVSLVMFFGLVNVGSAALAPIEVIDPMDFDFDITTYTYTGSGIDGKSTASGTSNGVGWSISPTNIWSGRTKTDDSFQFSALPVKTDNLHVSSDFTITFDSMIKNLLVVVSNDGGTDSLNFGIAPIAYSGLSISGVSQFVLNSALGGWALFENVNSFTVSHTNTNILDGFDLAFHAIPTSSVPIPGAAVLLGSALLGLVGFRLTRTV